MELKGYLTVDEQRIAEALGQMRGELRSLNTFLRDYIESHDTRHAVIDEKIDNHSDAISQAKGAKAALYTVAAVVSAAAGFISAKFVRWLS